MTSKNTPKSSQQNLRAGDPDLLLHELQTRLREGRRLFAEVGQILAEIDSRGVRELYGYKSIAVFYEHVARVTRAEAEKVADRALALHSRRQPGGPPIPPVAPLTGAAADKGTLANAGIDRIVTVMKRLPDHMAAEARIEAEKDLVDLATVARPRDVTTAGTDILARYDPEGSNSENQTPRPPRREFWLRQKRTGNWDVRGNLDSETGARLNALLVPLAHPIAVGAADPRTPAQRRGDAFAEIVDVAAAAESSPHIPSPRQESDGPVGHAEPNDLVEEPSPHHDPDVQDSRHHRPPAVQARLHDHSHLRRSASRPRAEGTTSQSRETTRTRPPHWWSRLSKPRSKGANTVNGKTQTPAPKSTPGATDPQTP